MTHKVPTWLFQLLLAALFLSSCEVKEITLDKVEGFEVTKVKGDNLNGTLSLTLTNPNSFSVKVKSADLEVFSNGKKLGVANLDKSIQINASSSETYPIEVNAKVGNLIAGGISGLAGLLTGKKPRVQIKGELRVGKMLYTKKVPIDIETDIPLEDIF